MPKPKPKRETGRDGYQASLIPKLRRLFPGCIILKNDPNFLQGVPDLLVLFCDKWASLECKGHGAAEERPNQRYYVNLMDAMSFSSFIYPEIEKEVLDALQRAFGSLGPARVSLRQQLSLAELRRGTPSRKVA